ncbi:DnaJ family domain-containing protein [Nocardia sp. NPDC059180]|uniref:DnaJ family domain-containing protein n=1 Tax=Nocardia sp. NPDC059180 TaxID=3346761 RepID=UPI0036A8F738
MTERKPPDLTFESWVDKQVREATERGEFEKLPGTGKPIPGAGTGVEENWWLRDYLRREGVRADGMLPESLVLRRDIEEIRETVRELDSERAVRAAVSELDQRIVRWVRTQTPPIVPIAPVDADEVVAQWRADRAPTRPKQPSRDAEPTASAPIKRRWWQRGG